jgi:hypothetical protein
MTLLRARDTRTVEDKCKAEFNLFLLSGTIMNANPD